MASSSRLSSGRSSPDLLALPISDATSSPARRVNLGGTPTPARRRARSNKDTLNSIQIQDFYIPTPSRAASIARLGSPTRTIAQTEDLISPWRIRVRVEAEHEDAGQPAKRRRTGAGRVLGTVSPSPQKMFGTNIRTMTVPLKTGEEEGKKRGRGRPRRSNGTPDPRAGTPKPGAKRRRSGVEELDEADTSSPTKRKRGRPRKTAIADAANGNQTQVPSSAVPSIGKGRRGRRKSLGPIDIALDMNSNEPEQSAPPDLGTDRDIDHAENDRSRSRMTIRPLQERSSLSPQKGRPDRSLFGSARRGKLQDPTSAHSEFDSIMESEGFSLITLGSVPSARPFHSRLDEDSEPEIERSSSPVQEDQVDPLTSDVLEDDEIAYGDNTQNLEPTDQPQAPATPSLLTRTAHFFGFRQNTPSVAATSPSAPVLPKPKDAITAQPLPSRQGPEPNSLRRAAQSEKLLQETMGDERHRSATRAPVKTHAQVVRDSSPKERLDDLFSGFGASARREQQVYRVEEDITQRQNDNIVLSQKDRLDRAAAKGQSDSVSRTRSDLRQSTDVLYPEIRARQLPSPEDSLERNDPDEMSWRVDTPDRVTMAAPRQARKSFTPAKLAQMNAKAQTPKRSQAAQSKVQESLKKQTPVASQNQAISTNEKVATPGKVIEGIEEIDEWPEAPVLEDDFSGGDEDDMLPAPDYDSEDGDPLPPGPDYYSDEDAIAPGPDPQEELGVDQDMDDYSDEEPAAPISEPQEQPYADQEPEYHDEKEAAIATVLESQQQSDSDQESDDYSDEEVRATVLDQQEQPANVQEEDNYSDDEVADAMPDLPEPENDQERDSYSNEEVVITGSEPQNKLRTDQEAIYSSDAEVVASGPEPQQQLGAEEEVDYSSDEEAVAEPRRQLSAEEEVDYSSDEEVEAPRSELQEQLGAEEELNYPSDEEVVAPRSEVQEQLGAEEEVDYSSDDNELAPTPETRQQPNANEETVDIWQLEAQSLSLNHQTTPKLASSLSTERPKPPRSKLPTPWRSQHSRQLIYSDDIDKSPNSRDHVQRSDGIVEAQPKTLERERIIQERLQQPREKLPDAQAAPPPQTQVQRKHQTTPPMSRQARNIVSPSKQKTPVSNGPRQARSMKSAEQPRSSIDQPPPKHNRIEAQVSIPSSPVIIEISDHGSDSEDDFEPEGIDTIRSSPPKRFSASVEKRVRSRLLGDEGGKSSARQRLLEQQQRWKHQHQLRQQEPVRPRLLAAPALKPSAPKRYVPPPPLSSDVPDEAMSSVEEEDDTEESEAEQRTAAFTTRREADETLTSVNASTQVDASDPDMSQSQNTTIVSLVAPAFQPSLPSWLPQLPSPHTLTTNVANGVVSTLTSLTSLLPTVTTFSSNSGTRPAGSSGPPSTFQRPASPSSPPPDPPLTAHLPWTVAHFRRLDRVYEDGLARPGRYAPLARHGPAARLVGKKVYNFGWEKRLEDWECGVVEAFLRVLEEEGRWDESGGQVKLIDATEVAVRLFGLWCGKVMRGALELRDEKVGLWDESLVRHRARQLWRQQRWKERNGVRSGFFW